MTDYDKSKVSPTPWVVTEQKIGTRKVYFIKNVNDNYVTGALDNKHVPLHIVHCVNTHDDLVKALEGAIGWMHRWNQEIDEVPYEVAIDMDKIKQILDRAKVKS